MQTLKPLVNFKMVISETCILAYDDFYLPLPRNALQNDIWFLAGNSTSADQAAAGECVPIFTNFLLVHGLLMFFGWGVCLVWGTFIARYFSSSGTTWFLLHRIFQVSLSKQCIINMFKSESGKALI